MIMMTSHRRLLAATALPTITVSATPAMAALETIADAGQDAFLGGGESKIALTPIGRTIDTMDDSLYYLTAVNADRVDAGRSGERAAINARRAWAMLLPSTAT